MHGCKSFCCNILISNLLFITQYSDVFIVFFKLFLEYFLIYTASYNSLISTRGSQIICLVIKQITCIN